MTVPGAPARLWARGDPRREYPPRLAPEWRCRFPLPLRRRPHPHPPRRLPARPSGTPCSSSLPPLLVSVRGGPPADAEPARGRRISALSFLAFACALLSKSATCTLPAAVALTLWWKRGRPAPGQVVALVPLAAVSV